MNKSTALESAGQHGVEVRPLSGMRDYTWGALVFAVEVALWSAAVAVGYHWAPHSRVPPQAYCSALSRSR